MLPGMQGSHLTWLFLGLTQCSYFVRRAVRSNRCSVHVTNCILFFLDWTIRRCFFLEVIDKHNIRTYMPNPRVSESEDVQNVNAKGKSVSFIKLRGVNTSQVPGFLPPPTNPSKRYFLRRTKPRVHQNATRSLSDLG